MAKWIQKAIKRPGRVRAMATRAGAITRRGTISAEWLDKKIAQVKKSKSMSSKEKKSLLSALLLAKRLRKMK